MARKLSNRQFHGDGTLLEKIEFEECGCGVPDFDNDGDGTADCHSCSGAQYDGHCWYLGEFGESCEEVCLTHGHGAYSAQTATYMRTDTQGGGLKTCQDILDALDSRSPLRKDTEKRDRDLDVTDGSTRVFGLSAIPTSIPMPLAIAHSRFAPATNRKVQGEWKLCCFSFEGFC